MGKVRTKLVKRVAWELLEKYPTLFTRDFSNNKTLVSKLTTTQSKKLRNQIAGYITHLVRVSMKKREHAATESEVVSENSA